MDFKNLTLAELKEKAKGAGIKNISKLKKEELILLLQENTSSNTTDKEKTLAPNTSKNLIGNVENPNNVSPTNLIFFFRVHLLVPFTRSNRL